MRYISKADNQRSGPHRRVEDILTKMPISFMSEEQFPPYTVDIYLPEWHLGIEIDGPLHSKSKDAVRDEYLEKYYYLPILRIDAKLWIKEADIVKKITRFIEEMSEDAQDRKRLCQTRL